MVKCLLKRAEYDMLTQTIRNSVRMKLLLCSDYGVDCPAEFRGEDVGEVLSKAKEHGRKVHGQTEEQVNSDEVRRIAEEHARDVE